MTECSVPNIRDCANTAPSPTWINYIYERNSNAIAYNHTQLLLQQGHTPDCARLVRRFGCTLPTCSDGRDELLQTSTRDLCEDVMKW